MSDTLTTSAVTLGGREFTVVDFAKRTVAMNIYLLRLVQQIGLNKLAPAKGETAEDYLVRLHEALVDSGKACEFIAGRLMPAAAAAADWSEQMAAEIAEHIGRCNAQADHERVLELGVRAVGEVFFLAGLEQMNSDLERSKRRG